MAIKGSLVRKKSTVSTPGWQIISLSIGATLPILLICFRATPAIFTLEPEVLLLAVMLYSWFFGLRGLIVILPVCWSILYGGWLLESRLAPSLDGGDFIVSGVICDVPRRQSGIQRFRFRVADDAVEQGFPRWVYLSWYDTEHHLRAGESWRLSVRLRRPRGVRNPAGFDAERWAFLNELGATGYIRKTPLNSRLAEQAAPCRWPAIRQHLAGQLLASVPSPTAAEYLPALAVGIRNGLSPRDWLMLQQTGTAHLIAISGLHIGLAAGSAYWLMRGMGRVLILAGLQLKTMRWAQAAALLTALAYSLLAGFALPAQRALVMIAVVILLSATHRSVTSLSALAVSLYVSLWLTPFAMLTAGFWMSFGAVSVLLLSGFGLQHRALQDAGMQTMRMRLVQLGRAQLFLAAGLLPLTVAWFTQVSIIAPFINILVVPVFALAIIPLLLTGMLTLVPAPWLSSVLLISVDAMLGHILRLLFWLSDAYPVAVAAPPFSGAASAVLCLLPLLLLWPRPLPGRVWLTLLGSMVMSWSLFAQRLNLPELRLAVLDTGQGLSVLIQSQDYAALYDAGPRFRQGDAGRSTVLPVLRQYRVNRLDHLIISHADADHAGGARSVLDAMPVAEILVSDGSGLTRPFKLCRAGQRWRHGQVEFRILHPDPESGVESLSDNDASCVLSVTIGQYSFLLPGDIERRAERRLVARERLGKMTLVIAPHHGSRTSSTPGFVDTLAPDFLVVSAGHRNRWGFPAKEVVGRWQQAGACILMTARHGALIFEVQRDGSLAPVRRWRVNHARIWSDIPLTEALQPACADRLL